MQTKLSTLANLEKVYRYKQKIAERSYAEQKAVVQKCIEELVEITEAILLLTTKRANNNEYMRDEDVSSDPVKMVKALKYKEQLEYDTERQVFYQSMAEEELVAQQAVLRDRLAAIEKFKVKIENVHKLVKKDRIKRQGQEEVLQEEVHTQSGQFQVGAYV